MRLSDIERLAAAASPLDSTKASMAVYSNDAVRRRRESKGVAEVR